MSYQFYIASRWRNKEQVIELAEKIRAKSKTVYCFADELDKDYELLEDEKNLPPEEFMAKYENIPDWIHDPKVRAIFETDMKALKNSEIVILLLPAGKSSHLEIGIAHGLGKKCILIGEQKEAESLYLIFSEFYNSTEDFIKTLS